MISLDALDKRVTLKNPRRPGENQPPPVAQPTVPKFLGREYVASHREKEIENYKVTIRILLYSYRSFGERKSVRNFDARTIHSVVIICFVSITESFEKGPRTRRDVGQSLAL